MNTERTPASMPEMVLEDWEIFEWCAETTIEDEQQYLKNGRPEVDYGPEWEEVRLRRADRFEHLGKILGGAGMLSLAVQCDALASELRNWNSQ